MLIFHSYDALWCLGSVTPVVPRSCRMAARDAGSSTGTLVAWQHHAAAAARILDATSSLCLYRKLLLFLCVSPHVWLGALFNQNTNCDLFNTYIYLIIIVTIYLSIFLRDISNIGICEMLPCADAKVTWWSDPWRVGNTRVTATCSQRPALLWGPCWVDHSMKATEIWMRYDGSWLVMRIFWMMVCWLYCYWLLKFMKHV